MVSGTDDDTPVPNGDLFQANTYTSSTQYDATVFSLGSDGFAGHLAGYTKTVTNMGSSPNAMT